MSETLGARIDPFLRALVLVFRNPELAEFLDEDNIIEEAKRQIITAVADDIEKRVYLVVEDTEFQKAYFSAINEVVRELRTQAEGKEE